VFGVVVLVHDLRVSAPLRPFKSLSHAPGTGAPFRRRPPSIDQMLRAAPGANGDYVETHAGADAAAAVAGVPNCRPFDALLLARRHCLQRLFIAIASLDFDEDDKTAPSGDDVDFSCGRADAAALDPEALQPQPYRRHGLSRAAGAVTSPTCYGPRGPRRVPSANVRA